MQPDKPTLFRARHIPALVQTTPSNQQFCPATEHRAYLMVQNTGGNVVYVSFGAPNKATTATDANDDYRIPAGGEKEWYYAVPSDAVYLLSPDGATACTIIEGIPLSLSEARRVR